SVGTAALSPQSKARPSLCSLVAPMSQPRVMPRSRPPYVVISSVRSAAVPGLIVGSQESCGRYGEKPSVTAGAATAGTGSGTTVAALAGDPPARPRARTVATATSQ